MGGITSKGIYGLSAMYELSLSNGSPMQIKTVAQRANVPQNYLEQLLPLLRKAGLLTSFRGASGGYSLAKNAKEITVLEIIETLEGDFCISSLQDNHDVLNLFWQERQNKINELFKISLYELQEYRQNFTYTI